MNPFINFDNLVRQIVYPHRRQPVRLKILRAFVYPLKGLFLAFAEWRDRIRMDINLSSQTIVLEGYLRRKFGVSIAVVTYDDGLLPVGFEFEGEMYLQGFGLEGDPFVEVPFADEIRGSFEGADFVVYVPAGVDIEQVRAEIERYKLATITYIIIQEQ